MSAALQDIVYMSIGMLRRLHLGVGSDIIQRRFPKYDVTDGHGKVRNRSLFMLIAEILNLDTVLLALRR